MSAIWSHVRKHKIQSQGMERECRKNVSRIKGLIFNLKLKLALLKVLWPDKTYEDGHVFCPRLPKWVSWQLNYNIRLNLREFQISTQLMALNRGFMLKYSAVRVISDIYQLPFRYAIRIWRYGGITKHFSRRRSDLDVTRVKYEHVSWRSSTTNVRRWKYQHLRLRPSKRTIRELVSTNIIPS